MRTDKSRDKKLPGESRYRLSEDGLPVNSTRRSHCARQDSLSQNIHVATTATGPVTYGQPTEDQSASQAPETTGAASTRARLTTMAFNPQCASPAPAPPQFPTQPPT